ncbi:CD209 antigen-like protein D [Nerophis lumbriciformis]|uniref:CD209 antigen-like protein D n=1 Tax=Nerophis lumbriciformis TaxID=546530 RepID=UPI002ADFE3AF|nr:dromaiocalcin-2-like [Nerophis lumbriciformis]
MAFSLRVFFLLCGISGVFGSCRSGWTLRNNECYIFEPSQVSYQDAKRNCETLGAQLVTINTARHNYTLNEIRDANADAIVDTWIELTSQGCGSSAVCAYIKDPAPDGACSTANCNVRKPYVCIM